MQHSLQFDGCLLTLRPPAESGLADLVSDKEDATARGQTAPLSLNAEITLRRVAHRVPPWRELPKRDLDHLEKLALIAKDRDLYTLTRLGKHFYQDGQIEALVAYVKSARK